MNAPIVYALQIYHEEVRRAYKIAQLMDTLCDRRGRSYSEILCLLVYRRDCPRDERLEMMLSSCFAGFMTHRTSRRETGFPAGPNGVWCDTMQHIQSLCNSNQIKPKCILTTETDAVPLCTNWPSELLASWEREIEKQPSLAVAGCWSDNGEHACGHINGNALFDPRLASRTPRILGCPPHQAWDTIFADEFKRLGWSDIPEIRNLYHKTGLKLQQVEKIREQDCAWLHGIKDSSAVDAAFEICK